MSSYATTLPGFQAERLARANNLEGVSHLRILDEVDLHALQGNALYDLVGGVSRRNGRCIDQNITEL